MKNYWKLTPHGLTHPAYGWQLRQLAGWTKGYYLEQCDKVGKEEVDAYLVKMYESHGKGDLIYHTMVYAIAARDVFMLKFCVQLLRERKRWHDSMNHPLDARNWLDETLSGIAYKLGIMEYRKHRRQGGMTRDPFTMVFAAAKFLDRMDVVSDLTVPWYIDRPHFWAWRRLLLKGKGRCTWEALEKINLKLFKHATYSLNLAMWRSAAVDGVEVCEMVFDLSPPWNYWLLAMYIPGCAMDRLFPGHKTFIPRQAYSWTLDSMETVEKMMPLDPDDEIKLDTMILEWAIDRRW